MNYSFFHVTEVMYGSCGNLGILRKMLITPLQLSGCYCNAFYFIFLDFHFLDFYKDLTIFKSWAYESVCVWLCAHECNCMWRPEEGVRSPGSQVTSSHEPRLVLGTGLVSLEE